MDLVLLFLGLAMFFTGLYKVAANKNFLIPALVSLAGAVITVLSALEVL